MAISNMLYSGLLSGFGTTGFGARKRTGQTTKVGGQQSGAKGSRSGGKNIGKTSTKRTGGMKINDYYQDPWNSGTEDGGWGNHSKDSSGGESFQWQGHKYGRDAKGNYFVDGKKVADVNTLMGRNLAKQFQQQFDSNLKQMQDYQAKQAKSYRGETPVTKPAVPVKPVAKPAIPTVTAPKSPTAPAVKTPDVGSPVEKTGGTMPIGNVAPTPQPAMSPDVSKIIGSYTDQMAAANKANEARYQQGLGIYDNIIKNFQSGTYGAGERASIAQRQKEGTASGMQQLASSGLYNTTIAPSIQARYADQAGKETMALNDKITQQVSQAQKDKADFIANRNDVGPDTGQMGNLLTQVGSGGGSIAPAPATNTNPTAPGYVAGTGGRQTTPPPAQFSIKPITRTDPKTGKTFTAW